MLTALSIRNYALINQLEVDFSAGFSVLTGETGAGKSIILGALSLILGQRADTKSIKEGENKCTIEGFFDISSYELKSFFEEIDVEYDPKQCIMRRELLASGKSRAFINDTPVGLNDLRTLGSQLIDIHSQHQNLLLSDGNFQIQVLDALADNLPLRKDYKSVFNRYISAKKQLQVLKDEAVQKTAEEDYLQFQYNQLAAANLNEGEQAVLESESEILSHLEEIKNGLFRTHAILSENETNIISSLKEVLNIIRSLNNVYPDSKEISGRLESVYLELKDLTSEILSRQDNLELDPNRLNYINERLDILYGLQQKHKLESIEALISLKNHIESQLRTIGHFEDQIASLESQVASLFEEVLRLSGEITKSRRNAGKKLEKELVPKVSPLGMPHVKFTCEITSKNHPDPTGADQVSFLFSANKNISLKPIHEIASGGEISRLMLGIKSMIAGAVALPTIIFDEIDTGVSGEVADKMGNIMHKLGNEMQVLTITHLPQIAAKGSSHYFVYKNDDKETTETHIRLLNKEERIREIAQMLSGSELTGAAMENAKKLMNLN